MGALRGAHGLRKVTDMLKIKVQELSLEKFRKYGDYASLTDDSFRPEGPGRSNEFYPDRLQIFFAQTTPTSVSICRVAKGENIISMVEYHQYTCEGLLPIDGDCVIFVGPSGRNVDPNTIEAFHIPQGTYVRLNPGVLHGRQFVYNTDVTHIMCMLPQRTYGNDMCATFLEGDDRIEVEI